jgi:transcriptional regulator with GAF, ATPase, and Fis domain
MVLNLSILLILKVKGKPESGADAFDGVIYLDEIGEMSLSFQSKLLHVPQSGEFAPLGSEKDVKSDVWVGYL